jgi:hypothetical protein
MQVCDVREWKDQCWTHLYEGAVFELDMVKLCARVWDAELAILSRRKEIRSNSAGDLREELGLSKAMGVLNDLRRLSGFENHQASPRRRHVVMSGAAHTRTHRRIPAAKRMSAVI